MIKVLSLGAGVQSTTILRMSIQGELDRLDAVVFADTQFEPQAVYTHLEQLKIEAHDAGIAFHVVSRGNLKNNILASSEMVDKRVGLFEGARMPFFVKNPDGSRGMMRRQCTDKYKIEIIEKKHRELLGLVRYQRAKPGSLECWLGISTDEMKRVTANKKAWVVKRYPLIFDKPMNRQDCLRWNLINGFPEPPRSACIVCPFRSNQEWLNIFNDKESWAIAVDFDKRIRKLAGLTGELYLHSSLVPLEEIDFNALVEARKNRLTKLTRLEDSGQTNFLNECSGHCGV